MRISGGHCCHLILAGKECFAITQTTQNTMPFEAFCDRYNVRNLNPQQEAAVKRVDGATLIVSVPGSGKTTVIVARTGYLIKCAGVNPMNILTLTYTLAAAKEMKARFMDKFKCDPGNTPHFSTIHSFCYKVLRVCESRKGLNLPKLEPSSERIIRALCVTVNKEYPSDALVSSLAQRITGVKNKMLTDEQIKELPDEDSIDFPEFYRAYVEYLTDNNLMDFDDMLVFALQFFQDYPDILAAFQSKYQYISVDEAQDTSLIQHKIVEVLASRSNNLFMVGDDDQSIYNFRGAYPKALLDFKSTYQGATVLSLETNYRSGTEIIRVANEFIKNNDNRHPKSMKAFSTEKGKVYITPLHSWEKQHDLLLEQVKQYRNSNKTLAVLYRNNEAAIPLLSLLQKENIAVSYRDDGKAFFSHFAVMDILAFMQLIMNPYDFDAFSKIYYKMSLYIKKQSLPGIKYALDHAPGKTVLGAMKSIPWLAKSLPRIEQADRYITLACREKPLDAIDTILRRLNYQRIIDDKVAGGSSEAAINAKINTLRAVAARCRTIKEFMDTIKELTVCNSDPASNVTLSTLHSSKGLEFDKVIIIDVIGGLLPRPISNPGPDDDPEEDARLFYVGITRARHELEIITARVAFKEILEPSEFIEDITNVLAGKPIRKLQAPVPVPSLVPLAPVDVAPAQFFVGDTVVHQFFGQGIITNIMADKNSVIADVTFENVQPQNRRLMLSSATGHSTIGTLMSRV